MKYVRDRTENFDDYYSYIEITKREIVNSNVYIDQIIYLYIYRAKNTRTIFIQIWSSNSLNLTEPF